MRVSFAFIIMGLFHFSNLSTYVLTVNSTKVSLPGFSFYWVWVFSYTYYLYNKKESLFQGISYFNSIIISSSSSCRAISTDIPDPLSLPPPYRPLLLAGPQGYSPYRHWAAVCRFQLVVLPSHVYVKGSTGLHHLWARPYFSSSFLLAWLV